MAVCSFLGHHDIYDVEIGSMLENAVERIAVENEKTEFLIYRCNSFYQKCFQAALKAKTHYPAKVTLTLILSEEDYSKDHTGGIPVCMVDKIIPASSEDCNSMGHKKLIQWLVQQSTHLVSYIYRSLYEQENHILDFAQRRTDLHIVDITDEDTAQEILKRTIHISDRERFIFESLNEGRSPQELAETMGISVNRLRQVLHHGCRTLRENMRWRRSRMSAEKQNRRKSICSIFSTGEVTYKSLKTFEYITNFLLFQCGVTHFEITADDRESGFMYVLKKYPKQGRILYNIAPLQNGFNADMVDHSDFCVCNLSSSPYAEEISEYISQAKCCMLIDMGQVCHQVGESFP